MAHRDSLFLTGVLTFIGLLPMPVGAQSLRDVGSPGISTFQAQLDPISAQILAEHNRVRAEVGAPPLQWDPELATAAAGYARELSRLGHLVHSPRAGRENQRENLSWDRRGFRPQLAMVSAWVDEKRNFQPGLFPNVSRTGNWADVAHYTQMIWKSTTHVGCAINSDTGFDYLVCRYSPPGNADGKSVP